MVLYSIFASAACLAAVASGHGAVTSYNISGKTLPGYQGYNPAQSPATIEWQWPSYNPILDVTSPNMTCNGGTNAALNVTVAAGSNITAIYGQWTHQQGPVMVWMYKCPADFASCDGSGAKWFKIDEMGLIAPPLTGTSWGTAEVVANLKWTSTIPATLAGGNYLIRHELLALHQAYTPQFYPECAQLIVTGTGNATPPASYLTPIPGYATAKDPGVYIDIYSSTATNYSIPGPPVWKP